MRKLVYIFPLLISAVALQGCSSKPRDFDPVIHAAPADPRSYEAAYKACRMQVSEELKEAKDRLASGGAGVVAGAAAGAAGSAVAGSTTTFVGGMAAAGAAVIAMPIVAVVGAWGLAKSKKLKKEKANQAATSECLGRAGYQVVGWKRAKPKSAEE